MKTAVQPQVGNETLVSRPVTSNKCPVLRVVPISDDEIFIDGIARKLRDSASLLRGTFKDADCYRSLTDYFVISMVAEAVPLIERNMALVKMHCIRMSTR